MVDVALVVVLLVVSAFAVVAPLAMRLSALLVALAGRTVAAVFGKALAAPVAFSVAVDSVVAEA